MIKFKKLKLLAAIGLISGSAFVFAENQGPLVTGDDTIETTGDFDVELKINNFIEIVNLDDVDLGTYNQTSPADLTASESFCVRSNSDSFEITLTGSNVTGSVVSGTPFSDLSPSNGFELADTASGPGADTPIPYSVSLSTLSETGTSSVIASDYISGSESASVSESRDTSGCQISGVTRDNISVGISVSQNDISGRNAGTYDDTITVLVSPE